MSRRSTPVVGPRKYQWSIASIAVLPDPAWEILASRFFVPQSSEFSPIRKKASLAGGTCAQNTFRSFSFFISIPVTCLKCCQGQAEQLL